MSAVLYGAAVKLKRPAELAKAEEDLRQSALAYYDNVPPPREVEFNCHQIPLVRMRSNTLQMTVACKCGGTWQIYPGGAAHAPKSL